MNESSKEVLAVVPASVIVRSADRVAANFVSDALVPAVKVTAPDVAVFFAAVNALPLPAAVLRHFVWLYTSVCPSTGALINVSVDAWMLTSILSPTLKYFLCLILYKLLYYNKK